MKRFFMVMMVLLLLGCNAFADDNVWALCKSYVNLRAKPSTKSDIVGYLDCGDGAETDWKMKGGWLHIISPNLETGDGWVNASFVVHDKPERIDATAKIVSNGRVALRKTVGGKRRAWCHHGDSLRVLWMSEEWSLTNRGYIKTEHLEVD